MADTESSQMKVGHKDAGDQKSMLSLLDVAELSKLLFCVTLTIQGIK
jgi:hypothetical protein